MANIFSLSTGKVSHNIVMFICYWIASKISKNQTNERNLATSYSKAATAYGNQNNERHQRIYHEIANYIPKMNNCKLLDIGCGNGELIEYIDDKFNNAKKIYYGVDLSLNMVLQAKMRPLKSACFINGSAESIPLCDGLVDVVVSSLCLHHLPNRNKALNEIHRVLKPGGTFICCTAAEQYLKEVVSCILDVATRPKWILSFMNQPPMYWPLSVRTLKLELIRSGFNVDSIYDHFWTDAYKSVEDAISMFDNITGKFYQSGMNQEKANSFSRELVLRMKNTQTNITLTDHLIFSISHRS